MARSRIRELLWTVFTFKDAVWKVFLITPKDVPNRGVLRSFQYKREWVRGLCVFDDRAIYIDAGQTEDEIGETLLHELFHVGREGANPEKDHEFFEEQSPRVWAIYKQLGVRPFPPLPEGWKTLQRSSRIWRGKREWS